MNLNHIQLPHKLIGSTDDFKQYYTNESVELVPEFFSEEIGLFNYKFE